jgi:lysozyme family protein
MVDIAELRKLNAQRWGAMSLTRNFTSVARSLVAPSAKIRYQSVSLRTKVPWFVIAVIHERESDQDWKANLAQGDPWDRVSTHVPKGRGPFQSWEDAAYDALVNCSPHAAKNDDWSIGGTLTLLEEYNGLGYAMRGLPSPYIWSGTDQYKSGKYVADGVFNPNAIDVQLGCAGLLRTMITLDPTIGVDSGTLIANTTINQSSTVTLSSTSVKLPPMTRVSWLENMSWLDSLINRLRGKEG